MKLLYHHWFWDPVFQYFQMGLRISLKIELCIDWALQQS